VGPIIEEMVPPIPRNTTTVIGDADGHPIRGLYRQDANAVSTRTDAVANEVKETLIPFVSIMKTKCYLNPILFHLRASGML